MEQTSQLAQERLKIFSDHLRTPSKNVGDIKKEEEPWEKNRSLKRLFRLEMDENIAQANIQVVRIHLIKT